MGAGMTQAYRAGQYHCAMYTHRLYVVSRETAAQCVRDAWDTLTHGPELTTHEMEQLLDNAILPSLMATEAIIAREALYDAGIEIEFWKLHNGRLV